jgi:hypothetical protein
MELEFEYGFDREMKLIFDKWNLEKIKKNN